MQIQIKKTFFAGDTADRGRRCCRSPNRQAIWGFILGTADIRVYIEISVREALWISFLPILFGLSINLGLFGHIRNKRRSLTLLNPQVEFQIDFF
jgi:hypothetical protein